MTTIPGTSSSSATTSTTAATTKTQALGQSDFLNLLVAQMKYQDPLNPSDPTQFTAQLAQYSQLEQLFNLNDAMSNLTTAENNSQRLNSLSLMGQDVVVEGSDFSYSGSPVQIGYQVDGTASDIKLNIKDSNGKIVKTLAASDVSTGSHYLSWDGKDKSGNTLAAGTYSIAIDATTSGGTTASVSPLVRATVTGIDLSGTDAKIVTALGEYKVSAIHGAYNSKQSALGSSSS